MNLSYDWDGEMERQQHESANQTNYRHWQEEVERDKRNGYKPREYKELSEDWSFDDELEH